MKNLLSQNSYLRSSNAYNWSIPALYGEVDGKKIITCPNAGICAGMCYARKGTYMFGNVRGKHNENLGYATGDRRLFVANMIRELKNKKYRDKKDWARVLQRARDIMKMDINKNADLYIPVDDWYKRQLYSTYTKNANIRIHDSGDFFSDEYTATWLEIIKAVPDLMFYAYTKEVGRFAGITIPRNLTLIYSYGGKRDDLIKPDDRNSDVFFYDLNIPEDTVELPKGYMNICNLDYLAWNSPCKKVGLPVNRGTKHMKLIEAKKMFSNF